jgi:hypothetical protein
VAEVARSVAFGANDPGTLPGMPGADDWPRASEMDAHLEWPSADDSDGGGSDETAPTTRGFFLGQLPEDEAGDVWADEPNDLWVHEAPEDVWADDHPDGGEVEGADPEGVLPDSEEDLDPLATSFETELHEPVATDGDATELSFASVADEPTQIAPGAVPSVSARRILRAARKQRGRARLSRIALVAGVVAALAAGTAVYVGTHANAGDQRASRSTSTSVERRSSSTTATTAATSSPAPGTEAARDPAAVPGSAAPTAPQGTSSAPAAPGSAAPTSPRAPGPTAAPPNSAAPPSSPPPRSQTCQVLPVLCP